MRTSAFGKAFPISQKEWAKKGKKACGIPSGISSRVQMGKAFEAVYIADTMANRRNRPIFMLNTFKSFITSLDMYIEDLANTTNLRLAASIDKSAVLAAFANIRTMAVFKMNYFDKRVKEAAEFPEMLTRAQKELAVLQPATAGYFYREKFRVIGPTLDFKMAIKNEKGDIEGATAAQEVSTYFQKKWANQINELVQVEANNKKTSALMKECVKQLQVKCKEMGVISDKLIDFSSNGYDDDKDDISSDDNSCFSYSA